MERINQLQKSTLLEMAHILRKIILIGLASVLHVQRLNRIASLIDHKAGLTHRLSHRQSKLASQESV